MFEGFGERGFGGEGEVGGGGRHGGSGGGQMDQLWEWLLLLQAMVCCCGSGGGGGKWKYSEASEEVRRRDSRQCMFGYSLPDFETFLDNAYNVLATHTCSSTVDLLLLSCQIVMLATAAVPPIQAEDITT